MLPRATRRRSHTSRRDSRDYGSAPLSRSWRVGLQLALIAMTAFIAISPFIVYLPQTNTYMHKTIADERELGLQNEQYDEKVTIPESIEMPQTQIRRGIANHGIFKREDIPYLWESVPEMVARMKAMPRRGRNTIFVSIASYRDVKCVETLADLYDKCKYCDRIFVGIADQIEDGDLRCLPPPKYAKQVTLLEMPASESKFVS